MQINPNVVVPDQNAILKPNPRIPTLDIPLVNPQQQLYPGQNPIVNRPSNMSGQNTVASNNFSHNRTFQMGQNDPFYGPGNRGLANNPMPVMYYNPNIQNPNYGTNVGNNTLNANFNPVPKEGNTYSVNDQKVEDYEFKQKV